MRGEEGWRQGGRCRQPPRRAFTAKGKAGSRKHRVTTRASHKDLLRHEAHKYDLCTPLRKYREDGTACASVTIEGGTRWKRKCDLVGRCRGRHALPLADRSPPNGTERKGSLFQILDLTRPPRGRARAAAASSAPPPSPHTTLNATGLGANGIARRSLGGYRSWWSGWLQGQPPFWTPLGNHSTPPNAWDACGGRQRVPLCAAPSAPPQPRFSARPLFPRGPSMRRLAQPPRPVSAVGPCPPPHRPPPCAAARSLLERHPPLPPPRRSRGGSALLLQYPLWRLSRAIHSSSCAANTRPRPR